MIRCTLTPIENFAAVGKAWRELEERADFSFFQSWTWMGCLAEQRFGRPVLLKAEQDGTPVALALLNRRRRSLFLGETGAAGWDSVFIEHNGLISARGQNRSPIAACLGMAAASRVVLSGVDEAHLLAARALPGVTRVRQTRLAPFVDYATLPSGPYLDSLSQNTRYQIRRSDRRYAARGALRIERAESAAQAHAFLADLAVLHQQRWEARGRAGAFAHPEFARFHHALIDRATQAREVDLLRIVAGGSVVGFLYNFVHRERVYAYQSGFDYEGAGRHEKPGLTCHRLAIELYRSEGMARYDFLAGDDRYKTSLANAAIALHWLEHVPRFSPGWFASGARRLLRR